MQLPGLCICSHLYIIQLPFRNSSSFKRPRAVAAPTTSLGPNWSKWFGKYLVDHKAMVDDGGGSLPIMMWSCSQHPHLVLFRYAQINAKSIIWDDALRKSFTKFITLQTWRWHAMQLTLHFQKLGLSSVNKRQVSLTIAFVHSYLSYLSVWFG